MICFEKKNPRNYKYKKFHSNFLHVLFNIYNFNIILFGILYSVSNYVFSFLS